MEHRLLVVECQPRIDWYEIFRDLTVDGQRVVVEQATWHQITLVAYNESGVVVSLDAAPRPLPGSTQSSQRTFQPTCVLMRSVTRSVPSQGDSRNLLFGLQFAGIPCINSLHSIYCTLERPWVYGELKKIQRRVGKDAFPLIAQSYYPSHREMRFDPGFPCVVKIGGCHAGHGKIRGDGL